ncbi:hypothetical protein L226DRAFT_298979 [Lentinus tigrinus ALCF2SS1-7]|uniref:uncharacterized protein n=1 Tax=Lentinus tigrinus ALCF2SS1-7 TaxID=1328758 RepID=UPI00116623FD|nr:hypothetical protein L226DRAFT_298979 [Lentinus tigrinus ALCF2SS1-7]
MYVYATVTVHPCDRPAALVGRWGRREPRIPPRSTYGGARGLESRILDARTHARTYVRTCVWPVADSRLEFGSIDTRVRNPSLLLTLHPALQKRFVTSRSPRRVRSDGTTGGADWLAGLKLPLECQWLHTHPPTPPHPTPMQCDPQIPNRNCRTAEPRSSGSVALVTRGWEVESRKEGQNLARTAMRARVWAVALPVRHSVAIRPIRPFSHSTIQLHLTAAASGATRVTRHAGPCNRREAARDTRHETRDPPLPPSAAVAPCVRPPATVASVSYCSSVLDRLAGMMLPLGIRNS